MTFLVEPMDMNMEVDTCTCMYLCTEEGNDFLGEPDGDECES